MNELNQQSCEGENAKHCPYCGAAIQANRITCVKCKAVVSTRWKVAGYVVLAFVVIGGFGALAWISGSLIITAIISLFLVSTLHKIITAIMASVKSENNHSQQR